MYLRIHLSLKKIAMPANKHALIRYRKIDQCLCNRSRRWTLKDLTEACSEALWEYEGIEKRVSVRTTQLDIQQMRSGKLGYEAPIVVRDRKYYTYSDPEFSIFKPDISASELTKLSETLDLLRQFNGFRHFEEIESIVQRLRNKIEVALKKRAPVIDLDRSESFTGLEFIDPVYQSILKQQVLSIHYHPFYRSSPSRILIHPYLLKEYNQRWYVIGFSDRRNKITTLALDRFKSCLPVPAEEFRENIYFSAENYFRDVVGITVDRDSPVTTVRLRVLPEMIPYVLTKPLHHSQEIESSDETHCIIRLSVRINNELKELIRGLGKHIVVLEPDTLRRDILAELTQAISQYRKQAVQG